MKLTEPDVEKYKRTVIILGAIILGCIILPPILHWLIYIAALPVAVVCGYLIYRVVLEYREQSDAKKLYDCVVVKELTGVEKIAKELGWNNAKTRGVIDFCVKKGFLDGYIRVGEELRKTGESEKEKDVVATLTSKKSARKCNHCGGVAEYYEGEKAVCVYCGNVIDE